MASTYSTNLKLQLMATGENSTTWGATTNVNLGTALEEATVGSATVTFSSANVTLTLTDVNTSQSARNLRLNLTGTTGGARDLIVPALNKVFIVSNGCADAVTVKNATGTGIAVPAGKTLWVYNNGTNVVDVVTHLTSLTLASALPTPSGGTGLTGFTAANNAIYSTSASTLTAGTLPSGAGGTGLTGFTAANSAIYSTSASVLTAGTLPVAAGGTGQNTYTDGQLLIGNSTGNTLSKATLTAGVGITITNGSGTISIANSGGAVTSVNLSTGSTGLLVNGTTSNVITSSGTWTLTGTLAATNGGTNLTGFTAANNAIYSTSASALTAGTLPVTAGGTGVTTSTGTGSAVLSTSPTLVTPVLGTPTSGTLTNCTFPALSIRSCSNVRTTATSGASTAAYTADQVVMQKADGTARVVNSLSATLNLANTDVVNGRDSAASSAAWYYVYAISNGTTDGVWLTTAATSPTLPSGYTYYARIGTAYTSGAAFATSFVQKNCFYALPTPTTIAGGATGGSSTTTPTWVAVNVVTGGYVPATACEIYVSLQLQSATGQAMAAPNNSYGAYNSYISLPPPPLVVTQVVGVVSASMVLESNNVYYAFSTTNGYLRCYGFTDTF
jgi:hypothetical protein